LIRKTKWDIAVRLAKYFGIISSKKSDEWVENDYRPFYFEINDDGELFAVPVELDDEDEKETLN